MFRGSENGQPSSEDFPLVSGQASNIRLGKQKLAKAGAIEGKGNHCFCRYLQGNHRVLACAGFRPSTVLEALVHMHIPPLAMTNVKSLLAHMAAQFTTLPSRLKVQFVGQMEAQSLLEIRRAFQALSSTARLM